MKTIVFDGRAFAGAKKEELKIVVAGLRSRGVVPHLASILVGDDQASRLYVSMKKKAAESIGAELDTYFLPEKTKLEDILLLIGSLNSDENVNGIMIQLPIPGELSVEKEKIIGHIDPKKDVDGLGKESQYFHPTSQAVIDILHESEKDLKESFKGESHKVAVVGATGMVGTPLVKKLKEQGYNLLEVSSRTKNFEELIKTADVVISATGIPGLIGPEVLKSGVVVIDVGSPHGDFDPEVEKMASFFTPVPGGVGPVTISCLMENLVEAC